MDTLPNRSQGYFENRCIVAYVQCKSESPDCSSSRLAVLRILSFYRLTERLRTGKSFKTHPSEDLETALKTLEIAELSFEEVAERHE